VVSTEFVTRIDGIEFNVTVENSDTRGDTKEPADRIDIYQCDKNGKVGRKLCEISIRVLIDELVLETAYHTGYIRTDFWVWTKMSDGTIQSSLREVFGILVDNNDMVVQEFGPI